MEISQNSKHKTQCGQALTLFSFSTIHEALQSSRIEKRGAIAHSFIEIWHIKRYISTTYSRRNSRLPTIQQINSTDSTMEWINGSVFFFTHVPCWQFKHLSEFDCHVTKVGHQMEKRSHDRAIGGEKCANVKWMQPFLPSSNDEIEILITAELFRVVFLVHVDVIWFWQFSTNMRMYTMINTWECERSIPFTTQTNEFHSNVFV